MRRRDEFRAGRRRAGRPGCGSRRRRSTRTTGGCCPRPLRAVERGARATSCGCCTSSCSGSPSGGRSCCEEPADEQAHLALIRASVGGTTSAEALRQFERLDQAMRLELGTTPEPGGRRSCAPRSRLGCRTAPAPGPERRRLFGRRAVGDELRRRLGGPRGAGAAAWCSADRRRRQDRRCSRWPRPCAPAGLAHWARGRLSGRGTVAVRAGPRGVERAVPQAPRAARRSGRRVPLRDRTRPRGAGRHLDRRVQPPAAVRRRGRADAPRCCRARRDAGRRRPARGRRGLHAAAALPVAARRDRAGAGRGRPPPRLAGPSPAGRGQPGRRGAGTRVELEPAATSATRRLLAERFPDLPEEVDAIVEVSGGIPFLALELARQPANGAAPALPALPPAVLRHVPAGGSARQRVHHRRAARPVRCERGGDLRAARGRRSPRRSSSPRRPATSSGTRWCARP